MPKDATSRTAITADARIIFFPFVINGTTGNDTFTIGQTVTVGTTSVTFDTGCSSNVTINGGAGNDTFNVTAAPTSGSLTLNGGAGTDILSNNTNVAFASTGIEITSNASGAVIIVTASSETADTDATISLSEAFAFFNDATVTGDYKIGFAPNIADTYLLDRALTSTYENTGHKLTIDGSQNRYDPATGQVVSQSANAVTVEARYDDTTTGSTYLQVNAGTTVEIVGLNLQHGNEGPWSRVHGITNSGTLTLIDGVRIHGFRTDGIVNYGTLTLGKDTTETQSPVSIYHNGFNEGNGIVNTGSGAVLTVYSALITGESDSQGTEKYGIYNVNGATSHLYGATADAVTISYHRNSGIYNDATSTVDITGASVINNHGIGIENEGELKIGETSSSAENVKILSNATDEIRNNATGKLYVYKGTIGSTHGGAADKAGIRNSGEAYIGTSTGGDAGDVKIFENDWNGIENISGGTLMVYNGTITGNGRDGIYNEGTATIGVSGRPATEVKIYGNGSDGIENKSGGVLTVYNAEICNNTGNTNEFSHHGINNAGTLTLQGNETGTSIKIYGNSQDGVFNSGTAEITGGSAQSIDIYGNSYGVQNNGSGSELKIFKAYIHENTVGGVGNANDGVAYIGTQTDGVAGDVLIVKNSGSNTNGIAIQGGNVTVYNATISENSGRGIYNGMDNKTSTLTLDGNSVDAIIIGEVKDADNTILYTGNTSDGIRNDSQGTVDIYKATITGNKNTPNNTAGISNNSGTVTIGGSTPDKAVEVNITNNNRDGIRNDNGKLKIQGTGSGENASIKIMNNVRDGIYNTADLMSEEGYELKNVYIYGNGIHGLENSNTGKLHIVSATIDSNSQDGIHNTGEVTIGTQNSGTASQIKIVDNGYAGIENRVDNGSAGTLTIYNAAIGGNTSMGIYNHKGGKAYLDGNTVDAIVIGADTGLGITGNSLTESFGGIDNVDGHSELHVYQATIKGNGHAGILNRGGTAFIGKENTGEAGNVFIINNIGDGIHTWGGREGYWDEGSLTVYNGVIGGNDLDGIHTGNRANESPGRVTLAGNSADAIIIGAYEAEGVTVTGNKGNGVRNIAGSSLTVNAATITQNTLDGIDNLGNMTLDGTGTGTNSSIRITGNGEDGIYNTADLENIQQKGLYIYNNTQNGVENTTTGKLHITEATIDNNTLDGIYNAGKMKVGIGSVGTAEDVMITNNGDDGIENKGNNANLDVFNATLFVFIDC